MTTSVANQSELGFFERLKLHPTGFWFVFWGELAERCSYYGMRTILALYLTTVLAYQKEQGAAIMEFFMGACYIAPLFGGWIADRILGRYKTILYFSVPYIIGHLVLGGIQTRTGLYVALVLLAFGSGSIKPNTSTLMGQIYEEQKKTFLLTEAFSYFYAAINIGAAVSSLSLPLVRDRWGYGVALAIPAALMAVAFIFFAVGKPFYPKENVRALPKKTAEQKQDEKTTLWRLTGVFLLISLFWLVYDQSASTWVYFANDYCNLTLFPGMQITADQVQGLNPVFIVGLTPIFNALWEMWKRRRGGIEVPDTRKMMIGFYIVIGCMAMMAVAGFYGVHAKVSIWWVVIATFVITLSELCISVVGLEFAFKQALPGTKSVVTAAFLFTVFIGDFAGGFVVRLYEKILSPGAYFLFQTVVMVITAIAFAVIARRFEKGETASQVN